MEYSNFDREEHRVGRYNDLIWWILDKRSIRRGFTGIIKDMHEGVVMSVGITCGETNKLLVTLGLHRGSFFCPYLFALSMDELTTHIESEMRAFERI